jgi:uncharacterized membrane protein (DUF4010 family)
LNDIQIQAAISLGIAAVIGLAIGLEREWSGHADGPNARFAGIRTFLMLGLLGGGAGLLAHSGLEILATALALGGLSLTVSAYIIAVRQTSSERDGTTEVAAILVIALGALAGAGFDAIAAGSGSLVVLALNEKKRLHGAVGRLKQEELRAALQFAVLALVVLPILPRGPYFGAIAFRPQALWIVVLVFSALNFATFLLRRSAGEGRGYLMAGLLGGVISSTAVTIGFARFSRREQQVSVALACGVVGACTVLVPRVLIISSILSPAVALVLLRYIAPAGLVGAVVVGLAWRYGSRWENIAGVTAAPVGWLAADERNPLRLWVAIKLAIVFQVAITVIMLVRDAWAVKGLYTTAVLLGLTDVDALTVSMSTPATAISPLVAARAITIGILANTIVKLGISTALGSSRFRLTAGGVLLLMAAAMTAAVMLY